jgi:hypothetical protein
MKKALSTFIFLAAMYCSAGQQAANKWQYSAVINFTVVPTFNIAATDTSFKNSLSFAPSIGIRNSNGLGFAYTPKFVVGGPNPGIYMHAVTFGFESYNKKKLDFFADLSHYFLTKNISVPATPITNELYTAVTYKKYWVRPMLLLGVGFGTNQQTVPHNLVADVAIAVGVSHLFYTQQNKAAFSFIPALKVNAGTNDYFSLMNSSKYISANKDFNKLITKTKGTAVTDDSKSITLNNIETTFEAAYQKGVFSLRPEVSFIFPAFSKTGNAIIFIGQLQLRYDF